MTATTAYAKGSTAAGSLDAGHAVSRIRPLVTGVGVVTCAGSGAENFFAGILAGTRTWTERNLFPDGPACTVAAIPDDAIAHGLRPRQAKRVDRFTLLAIAAVREALADARVDVSAGPERIGLLVGNVTGGWSFVEPQLYGLYGQGDLNAIDSFVATAWFPTAPQGELSILLGIAGLSKTVSAENLSAAMALDLAAASLRDGQLDTVVVCGAEAPLNALVYNAVISHGILGWPGEEILGGNVLGEGAAAIVLQDPSAVADGATPYAALDAVTFGGDFSGAVTDVLEKARQISAAPVDFALLDARAATPTRSRLDAQALDEAVGGDAPFAVSAPATTYGNLLGAAFAVQLVAACLALRRGKLPPYARDTAPPDHGRLSHVRTARTAATTRILVHGTDDYGQGACAVLSAVPGTPS